MPMATVWMRMPGQSWAGSLAVFLGMWIVMTAAMMLPSLTPMLRVYRRAVAESGAARLFVLTVLVAAGYFCVWTVLGAVVFPVGVASVALSMNHPGLQHVRPFAAAAAVLIAGAYQLAGRKARHLACCRRAPFHGRTVSNDARTAWRQGIRVGVHCARCCGNLMAIGLVLGVMDPAVMTAVGAAITLERIAPIGDRIAPWTGAAVLGAGMWMVVRALA
jgi:predicted metal-binding membrane protein